MLRIALLFLRVVSSLQSPAPPHTHALRSLVGRNVAEKKHVSGAKSATYSGKYHDAGGFDSDGDEIFTSESEFDFDDVDDFSVRGLFDYLMQWYRCDDVEKDDDDSFDQVMHDEHGLCTACVPFLDESASGAPKLIWIKKDGVYQAASAFMRKNMNAQDLENGMTYDHEPCCDGSSILDANIHKSILAKCLSAHSRAVPLLVWLEHVVPYGHVNEPRTNWRLIFWKELVEQNNELVRNGDIVELWTLLNSDSGPVWGCTDDNAESSIANVRIY